MLKNGVTEAELAKAKNRLLTAKLLERETNNGKASALGEAAVLYGDAERVNTDLAQLQAVTTAQIKEVLNRYITGKKKVVIEYLPEAMKPAAKRRARRSPDENTHSSCGSRRLVFLAAIQFASRDWRRRHAPGLAPHEMTFASRRKRGWRMGCA